MVLNVGGWVGRVHALGSTSLPLSAMYWPMSWWVVWMLPCWGGVGGWVG